MRKIIISLFIVSVVSPPKNYDLTNTHTISPGTALAACAADQSSAQNATSLFKTILQILLFNNALDSDSYLALLAINKESHNQIQAFAKAMVNSVSFYKSAHFEDFLPPVLLHIATGKKLAKINLLKRPYTVIMNVETSSDIFFLIKKGLEEADTCHPYNLLEADVPEIHQIIKYILMNVCYQDEKEQKQHGVLLLQINDPQAQIFGIDTLKRLCASSQDLVLAIEAAIVLSETNNPEAKQFGVNTIIEKLKQSYEESDTQTGYNYYVATLSNLIHSSNPDISGAAIRRASIMLDADCVLCDEILFTLLSVHSIEANTIAIELMLRDPAINRNIGVLSYIKLWHKNKLQEIANNPALGSLRDKAKLILSENYPR